MKDNNLFADADGVTENAQDGDQALDMNKFSSDDDFLGNLDNELPSPGQDHQGDINEDGGEPNEFDDGEVEFNMDEDLQSDMLEVDYDEEGMLGGDDTITEDALAPEGQEETNEDESAQLELMNKTLDTDYKSLKELKDALNGTKSTDTELPEVEDLPAEKIQEYDKNKNLIDYFAKQKMRPDSEIVFDYLKNQELKKSGLTELSEEQIDALEDKVSVMDTSGTLELYSENVKNKMDNVINRLSSENQSIDQQRNQISEKRDTILKSTIQESMVDYFKKDFYGIKLDKERTQKAYNSIVSNDLFKSIENSPKRMVDVALFLEYQDMMAQKTGGPTYSDGVKAIMSEIDGQKSDPMTAQIRNRTVAKSGKSLDLKSRFLS